MSDTSVLDRRQPNHSNGFPRSARLLSAADYAAVFGDNKRLSDKNWTVLVARGQSDKPRIGMAVAKKRAKRAVDRNRLKRIVRESFRLKKAELEGIDMVVMNRDHSIKASNSELRDSLIRLFEKASVTKR